MSTSTLAGDTPVIDSDAHITEPPDLWTSRLPRKWHDIGPRVVRGEDSKHAADGVEEYWMIGDERVSCAWGFSTAGWKDWWPSHPTLQEQVDPATYDATARAARLDDFGIASQVLYPNILGFYLPQLMRTGDREFQKACVQAYNDFLSDFAAEQPGRFIPIMTLPFWDLEASVAEVERCAANGHKGILFSNAPDKAGMPRLRDQHWDPLFSLAQEAGLSLNFHVGFTRNEEMEQDFASQDTADFAKRTTLAVVSNIEAICELIVSGLCERYPRLNFVSVESGFGYVPYILETLDWQWRQSGAHRVYPDRLLPSEYFKRQIYTTFWFEREPFRALVGSYPDNVMFESDFPHPTCLAPGPASASGTPSEIIDQNLEGLPPELIRKVLYENAARVYGLGA